MSGDNIRSPGSNQNAPQRADNSNAGASRRSQGASGGRSQSQSGRSGQRQQAPTLRITYLQNPTVEIIHNQKVVGAGIKKTLAYDTPLAKEALENWRRDFWETRTNGHAWVWQLLQNACALDEETALAMIEAAELQMPEKCLTTVIDTTGVYYRVPIACINDPDNYGVNKQMDEMKQKVAPDQKQLNIKIRNAAKGDQTFQASNLSSVLELKTQYIAHMQAELKEEQIRFFYMGKEMLNDFFLYSYDVVDDMVIAGMIRPAAN